MRQTPQNFKAALLSIAIYAMLAGCASSKHTLATKKEISEDAISALGAVASSYSLKEVSEEELKEAVKEIQKDEEAQSAIKAITGAYEGESAGIKYSPKTGKRYSGNLEYDPETGAKLIPLEE